MKVVIKKFGGTSVSTVKNIKTIASVVAKSDPQNKSIIVVSALSGVTDLLLSLLDKKDFRKNLQQIRIIHTDILKSIFDKKSIKPLLLYIDDHINLIEKKAKKTNSKEFRDSLIAEGEIISSYIIAEFLKKNKIHAQQVIASEIIKTDNNFGSAEFLVEETKEEVIKVLGALIKKGITPVVTGFIGSTKKGKITTLGRGGSDYTAAIIGYCLSASEIQIWTDVNGIFTADPRIVKNAKVLPEISYKEASELAFFGAKVLHPRTIRPAVRAKIPIRVLNTFHPETSGTLVLDKPNIQYPITAISFKKNITLVNMYSTAMLFSKGFLARLFDIFAKHNISIDLVGASEVSISVTLENDENLSEASAELKEFTSVTITKSVSIISLVGEGLTNSTEVIKHIFTLLDKKKILVKMVSLGATNINISLVVETENLESAVKVLHDGLLLKKLVNLRKI